MSATQIIECARFIQSYLIGLWFSLRTHASQIWQNPQPLLHSLELPGPSGPRLSVYQRHPGSINATPSHRGLNRKASNVTNTGTVTPERSQTPVPRVVTEFTTSRPQHPSASSQGRPVSPILNRRVSYAPTPAPPPHGHQQPGYTPLLESVDHAIKNTGNLPENMTTDDFTRAVAVATVSALRHQQSHAQSPARTRMSGLGGDAETEASHGGHEGPSWSRTTSAAVLLGCTALYAVIAGKALVKHVGYLIF